MLFKKQKRFSIALLYTKVVISIFLVASCQKNLKQAQKFPTPIDLNKIVMEPMSNAEGKTLPVHQNESGEYYILLNLNYSESNINVIDAIKRGNILMHRIVVRNARGEEIGWDTINFQAYKVNKITTITSPSNVLMTKDGKKVIEEEKSAEQVKYYFEEVQYQDTDKIPQTIFFNRKYNPGIDNWVSIYVEIIYIQPVIAEVCSLDSTGQSFNQDCFRIEEKVFEVVRRDNMDHIAKLKTQVGEKPDSLTRLSLPPLKSGSENIVEAGPGMSEYNQMVKAREYYRQTIADEIKKINNSGKRINEDKDILTFQEWRLVSAPRYFSLSRGTLVRRPPPEKTSIKEGTSTRLQLRITGAESRNSILLAKIIKSGENSFRDYTVKIPVPNRNAASRYGLRVGQSVTIEITISRIDHKNQVIYAEAINL